MPEGSPGNTPARGRKPAKVAVLISGSGIGFIDFDGFCQAEPALDLALFRTTVRQLGWKPEHNARLSRVADDFLADYNRIGDASPMRIALWEALDLLTRVLHCWTKVKPEKLPQTMADIEHELTAEPLAL